MDVSSKRVTSPAVPLRDLPYDVLNQIAALVPEELHMVCKRLRAAVHSTVTGLELPLWRIQHPVDRQRLLRLDSLTELCTTTTSPAWSLAERLGGVERGVAYGIALALLEDLPQHASLACENKTQNVLPVVARLTFLRSLSLQNSREVAEISHLTTLSRLANLDLSRTAVVDVSALAALPALQELNHAGDTVGGRQINMVTLEGLTSLSSLDLSNQSDTADASSRWLSSLASLASLTSLTYLDLSVKLRRAGPDNLAPLAALTGLQELYLEALNVHDVAPLAGMINLVSLYLTKTQVQDVRPLSGLSNLVYLSVRLTPVQDLTSLAGLVNLQVLWLGNTQIEDLSPLTALAALTRLDLRDCSKLKVLDQVGRLTPLRDLDLRGCPITDVSPLTSLTSLTKLCLSSQGAIQIAPLIGMRCLKDFQVIPSFFLN